MEQPAPPVPLETKVAMGALVLLSFQELHDFLAWCANPQNPGAAGFGPGAVLILLLNLGILIGLFLRSRRAWWLGVVALGGLGVLSLVVHGPRNRWAAPERAAVCEMEDLRLAGHFRAFWLISKIALMLAVPAALLTGRLRERLRGR